MDKNTSFDQAALAFKVLDGKASPQEHKTFELWLSQNPENWEEYADLKMLWESSHRESHQPDSEAFNQIKTIVEKHRRKQNLIKILLYIIGVAALSILIYSITIRYMEQHDRNLRFDNASVGSVIREVERIHHVHIECDKEIIDCTFSGIFFRRDDAEVIIKALTESLGIQILRPTANTFKLTGKGC
jgi:ferric-dicitrate binding protein FerR (iron transport regulator)